jgi:Protein of unknown function (DUF1538)
LKVIISDLLRSILDSIRDLAPIIIVIAVFQIFILKQPIPNLAGLAGGLLMVIVGLAMFVRGLEIGLFPIGESMAHAFARKGSVFWLMIFAFLLGFGTSIAEPALIAIARKAAEAAAEGGAIANTASALKNYELGLRYTVGFSVGVALMLGVLRIIRGWPVQYVIIGAYIIIVIMTPIAPSEIIGIAYDSGGVTTSTITVPLVTALGIGLSSSIKGRNPMVDGFGLIAFASVIPIAFTLIFGMFV